MVAVVSNIVTHHSIFLYIQTFIFENAPVMIVSLHKNKTSASMASTLDYSQENLVVITTDFSHCFLLTEDLNSKKIDLFETNQETGEMRSNIFYCDSQRPS